MKRNLAPLEDNQISSKIVRKREREREHYQGWNRDSTTDPEDIKRIIKKYYEQLYRLKFDNWDEMERSLE